MSKFIRVGSGKKINLDHVIDITLNGDQIKLCDIHEVFHYINFQSWKEAEVYFEHLGEIDNNRQ